MKGNRQLNHAHDFTRDNYRKLLQLAKQHYTFTHYDTLDKTQTFILWRHDVDFSMHAARKLAIIEAEEGVSATYFLLLHSEFYNLLESEIVRCVKDIQAMGHHVALHFDTNFYNINDEEQLTKYLLREKNILESFFEQAITVFSFHNPSEFALSCKKWQYAQMINTYAAYFQASVGYCSDSNGYWRHRRLEDVLREHRDPCLQILTHPEWWTQEVMTPRERVSRCIAGRAIRTGELYDNLLEQHNRLNIR